MYMRAYTDVHMFTLYVHVMYTRTRARAHTQSTTCHVTGKTLLTPAQEYLLHCGDPRCCSAAYDTAIHVLLVQARDLGPMT